MLNSKAESDRWIKDFTVFLEKAAPERRWTDIAHQVGMMAPDFPWEGKEDNQDISKFEDQEYTAKVGKLLVEAGAVKRLIEVFQRDLRETHEGLGPEYGKIVLKAYSRGMVAWLKSL